MPRDRRHVGALAPLPHVRPRGLLRQLQEPSRTATLPRDGTSDRHLDRTWRELELVFRRRDVSEGPECIGVSTCKRVNAHYSPGKIVQRTSWPGELGRAGRFESGTTQDLVVPA